MSKFISTALKLWKGVDKVIVRNYFQEGQTYQGLGGQEHLQGYGVLPSENITFLLLENFTFYSLFWFFRVNTQTKNKLWETIGTRKCKRYTAEMCERFHESKCLSRPINRPFARGRFIYPQKAALGLWTYCGVWGIWRTLEGTAVLFFKIVPPNTYFVL